MKQKLQEGFILPATIMLGLAISIVSVTFMQYIVNAGQTLNAQAYTSLAREAADSGIAFAISCFNDSTTRWNSPLKPDTYCAGNSDTRSSEYLASSPGGEWKSRFSVADPQDVSGGRKKIVAIGTVDIFAGGVKVNEITATRDVIMETEINTSPVPPGDALTDLASDSHSCAIANGKLYCWGLNNKGQLGTGNTTSAESPRLVAAASNSDIFYNKIVTHLAVGTENTCAVADGQLYCWGDNTDGQLGDSTTGGYKTTPQLVPSLSTRKITSIALSQSSAGGKAACAVSDGITYCWGSNSTQQIGQTASSSSADTTSRYTTPIAVFGYKPGETSSPLYQKKSFTTGIGSRNGCSTIPSKMVCWGIADGTNNAAPPTDKGYGNTIEPWSVNVAGESSCGIVDANLYCHGRSSAVQPPFTNSVQQKSSNAVITAFDGDESISNSGSGRYCYATRGDAYCQSNPSGPYLLSLPHGSSDALYGKVVSKIGVGERYGCMVANGGLACWGSETDGQLANGGALAETADTEYVAQDVIGTPNLYTYSEGLAATGQLAAGQNHQCAIANGFVFCWGSNTYGQLGTSNRINQSEPTAIHNGYRGPFGSHAEKVASGGNHSCVITDPRDPTSTLWQSQHDTALYCWGSNDDGELGTNGSATSYDTPQKVGGLQRDIGCSIFCLYLQDTDRITDVSAGANNTCAISNDQLYCWGDNTYGQLGTGTIGVDRKTPQLVPGFAGKQVMSVSVGTTHICAIADGDGYCWGDNTYGQLGSGNTAAITSPGSSRITGGRAGITTGTVTAAFTAISAGNGFTCAIINGTAACWGNNTDGRAGTGSTALVPTELSDGTPGGRISLQANAISAGNNHACAVLQGKIYCWGNNDRGKIGNNLAADPQLTPAVIDTDAAFGRASVNIASGDNTTCSVSNGRILCWGAGDQGQLGISGGSVDNPTPQSITGYRKLGATDTGPIY